MTINGESIGNGIDDHNAASATALKRDPDILCRAGK
jgi:hypothetical protein